MAKFSSLSATPRDSQPSENNRQRPNLGPFRQHQRLPRSTRSARVGPRGNTSSSRARAAIPRGPSASRPRCYLTSNGCLSRPSARRSHSGKARRSAPSLWQRPGWDIALSETELCRRFGGLLGELVFAPFPAWDFDGARRLDHRQQHTEHDKDD